MSAMQISKSLSLSSNFTMNEEAKASEKQGIVSILATDIEKTNTGIPSLRRTLSADMSCKKWLAQNGFSSVKKISSSHELLASISDSSSTSSDDQEDYIERSDLDEKERLDIWNSIQQAKMKKAQVQEPAEKTDDLTSWISILSQKGEDPKMLPPPYVHPLVKRSASTLSEKSLEICTESLGSETGSDGFSSYAPSEADDAEDDKVEGNQAERAKQTLGKEEYTLPPVKYNNYLGSKKAAQLRSFPPPLPSLSRGNGASLSMKSSRNNGRLVLEAVSVSSQNNFQAQRLKGRLILTFVNDSCTVDQEVGNVEAVKEKKSDMELDEESVVFDGKGEDEENGNEEDVDKLEKAGEMEEIPRVSRPFIAKETAFSMEKASGLPGGVMSLHKLALLMNKPIGLPNSNPRWGSKFNEVVNKYTEAVEEEEEPISLEQSLPLQPQVARMIPIPPTKVSSSLNTYEYFWRTQPTSTSSVNAVTKQTLSSLENYCNNCTAPRNSLGRNELQHYAGAPMLKSCNESRRSLFFWEPNCIATS